MSERSTKLDLPYIQPAQAQKHVTHNEAIELLDMIVQLSVEEFDAETPPVAPVEGQNWSVGPAATGVWSGNDGMIASYRSGGWMFVPPQEGWLGWDQTEKTIRVFSEGTWKLLNEGTEPFQTVGINTTADPTNRLSVASEAVLFTHDGAGHQVKVNKANASETASVIFQSNWSGRAEMGLTGGDDFTVKVSADGANWAEALTARGTDGAVKINSLLNLSPSAAPVTPEAGDVYFDALDAKLRCFDGAVWRDLY